MVRAERVELLGKASAKFIHVPRKERLKNAPPLIIAPGFGETAGNFEKLAQEMAQLGHETYALTPTKDLKKERVVKREQEKTHNQSKAFYKDTLANETFEALWKSLPPTEVRRAVVLIDFIEKQVTRNPGERVQAIGHSQGGAYVLIAAFMRPDLFEHIILANPAGQSGKEDFGFLKGLFNRFHKEVLKTGNFKIIANAATYIATQGLYLKRGTVMREGAALAAFNAYPLLDALSNANPPVAVTTQSSEDDLVFPTKKIDEAESRERAQRGGKANFGRRVRVKHSGHYGLITRSKDFAAEFHQMLTQKGVESAKKKAA